MSGHGGRMGGHGGGMRGHGMGRGMRRPPPPPPPHMMMPYRRSGCLGCCVTLFGTAAIVTLAVMLLVFIL